MRKDIASIKKATDAYLTKHPFDDRHGLYYSIMKQYKERLVWLAAHGDIDGIEKLVIDIFNFGAAEGMRNAACEARNDLKVKSIGNGRIADESFIDAVKNLADQKEGR